MSNIKEIPYTNTLERITALERDLQALKSKGKSGWDVMQLFMPVIQAVLIGVIGFVLTGRVTNAIQQKQLELSNVKEMRELIRDLGNDKIDVPGAESAAMTLAAFGEFSVSPLIQVIDSKGINASDGAEKALRAAGLTDRKTVCSQLSGVIANRTGLFRWSTHDTAIRVIGDLQCTGAREDIKKYQDFIGQGTPEEQFEHFKELVRSNPAPSDGIFNKIQAGLSRTQKILAVN